MERGVDEQYPAKFGHVCLSLAVMMNKQEDSREVWLGLHHAQACSCRSPSILHADRKT